MRDPTGRTAAMTRLRCLLQKAAQWLHAALILAGVVPALYMMSSVRNDPYLINLFLIGLLLITPVTALLRIMTEHVRSLLVMLIAGLLLCAAVFRVTEGAGRAAASDGSGILIQILFAAEVLFLLADACSIRLQDNRRARARLENDISYRESPWLFEEPQAVFLAWFVLLYLGGLMMKCPTVCDIAIWSGTAYFLLFCAYRSSRAFDEYLAEHSGVTHIPVRRMRKVGRAVLTVFILIAALGLLPAVLSGGARRFVDIREIHLPMIQTYEEEYEPAEPFMDPEMMSELFGGEQREPPIILEFLFQVLSFASVLLMIWLIVRAIRSVFRQFRDRTEENGDIITAIEPEEEIIREKRPAWRFAGAESRREQIRRRYRTLIRKYRKDKPKPFETPEEIEENAGIAGMEEVVQLHRLYEEVRYGRE